MTGRFVQAFVIGLLASAVILFFYRKDQSYRFEIDRLNMEVANLSASVHSTAPDTLASQLSDVQASPQVPKLDVNQTAIWYSRQNAITRAIARTSDAVVGISVTQIQQVQNPLLPMDPFFRMFYDEQVWPRTIQQRVNSVGSGFITTPDGYIVTNEHVVRNAERVVVTTTAGIEYDAKIIGTDPLLDMALLKIDDTRLPYIDWADSQNAIVGEWVIAIGNPYGLFDVNDQPSVSVGVISALNRDFERSKEGRLYTDMIQTDAAINRGNSGGPLINSDGQALGMNTLIFTETGGSVGVGFAIPAHRITAAIDDLLKGGVDRNYWIGIRVQDLSGMSYRFLGLQSNSGALITWVDPASPAETAGLKVKDVLLAINTVPVKNSADARYYLKNNDLRVGDELLMSVFREGKTLELRLTLAAIPVAANSGKP